LHAARFHEKTPIGPQSAGGCVRLRAIPAESLRHLPEYDACVKRAGQPEEFAGPSALATSAVQPASMRRSMLLFHGPSRSCGQRFCHPSPTFGILTGPCAQMQGMAIEAIPYWERISAPPGGDSAHRPVQSGPARACVLLCNPNNPTRHCLGSRVDPGAGCCRTRPPLVWWMTL